MLYILSCPLEETHTANSRSVLIATTLAVLLGMCIILMLFIVGLFLISLFACKQKHEESSQAVSEDPELLNAIDEDPNAALPDKFQPSAVQNMEVETADNVAYYKKLQFLRDKEIDAQENVAYCTTNRIGCFAHDLTWWAHQLVHIGDDSASARHLERFDTV